MRKRIVWIGGATYYVYVKRTKLTDLKDSHQDIIRDLNDLVQLTKMVNYQSESAIFGVREEWWGGGKVDTNAMISWIEIIGIHAIVIGYVTEYQLRGLLSNQCEVKVFILGYIFVKIVRVFTILIQSDLLRPRKHVCQRIHVGWRQHNNTYVM